MTSLFSGTVSPSKDGTSSLPRRQNSLAKPPLRALYDLLIAPMEGVSGSWDMTPLGIRMHLFFCLVRMRTTTPPPQRIFFLFGAHAHPQSTPQTSILRWLLIVRKAGLSLCFALLYMG